jgi:uncharacterized membrane protein
MFKRNIYFDFSYFIVLSMTAGAVFVLGAIVAPIIFHSDAYTIGMMLDHYNMGIIMGEIFRRFSYVVYLCVLFVIVYEVYMYKMMQIDKVAILSAFMVIFSGLMFSAVYVPQILSYQTAGAEATMSDSFNKLHLASELDFKLLAISLLVLFIRRLMLLRVKI